MSKVGSTIKQFIRALAKGHILGVFFLLVLYNVTPVLGTVQALIVAILSIPLAYIFPIVANTLFDLLSRKISAIRLPHTIIALLFIIVVTKFTYGVLPPLDSLPLVLSETLIFTGYFLFLIALVCGITLLSIAFGERTVRALGIRLPATGALLCAFALGQAMIMLLMFVLGVLGLYYSALIYGIFGLALIIERQRISQMLISAWRGRVPTKQITLWFEEIGDKQLRGIAIVLFIFCTASAFLMIVNSVQVRPYNTDTLIIYMSFPKASAEIHAMANYEGSRFNYFPKNAEMLYALGFLLVDHNFASLLILVYMAGALCTLFLLSQLLTVGGTPRGPPVFVFYFLLIPMVIVFGYGFQKVDIILLFYILLSVYVAVLMQNESRLTPWALLLGVLLGVALGIKYTAIFSIIAVLLALPLLLGNNVRRIIGVWLISGVVIVAMFAPWAMRNFILIGNPVAPFFLEQLSSGNTIYDKLGEGSYTKTTQTLVDSAYYQLYNREQKGWQYYATLPFRITANSSATVMRANDVGPLFLAFIFLLFSTSLYLYRTSKYIAVVVALHILAFVFAIEITCVWYIMPAFPLLLLLYQSAFNTMSADFRTLIMRLVLVAGGVALFAAGGVHPYSLIHPDSNRVSTMTKNRTYFRELTEIQEVSRLLSSPKYGTGKVHLLNDGKVYFLEDFLTRVIPATHFEIFGFLYDQGMSNADMTRKFNELGVSYLLLNKFREAKMQDLILAAQVHAPIRSAHYRKWYPAFLTYANEELEPIYEGEMYTLYKFKQ